MPQGPGQSAERVVLDLTRGHGSNFADWWDWKGRVTLKRAAEVVKVSAKSQERVYVVFGSHFLSLVKLTPNLKQISVQVRE